LASDTLLRHPILAILPNFTFFDHQYATELVAIDDTKFHLSKAINHSIAREITFHSMAEYLTQHNAQFTNDENIKFSGIPHVYSSPLLFTLILSVIAIVFFSGSKHSITYSVYFNVSFTPFCSSSTYDVEFLYYDWTYYAFCYVSY